MSSQELEEFIRKQVAPVLERGEVVGPSAYLMPMIGKRGRVSAFVDAASKMAAFGVLTDRRLILVQTRIGAFRPLLENRGVVSLTREKVRGVFVGGTVMFELADGTMAEFVNNASKNYVATQAQFFQRLPEFFGVSQAAADLARREKQITLIAFAVCAVAVLVYLWYRVH